LGNTVLPVIRKLTEIFFVNISLQRVNGMHLTNV
jgi:hypothetical protein